jgi:subtilisin family serine protease
MSPVDKEPERPLTTQDVQVGLIADGCRERGIEVELGTDDQVEPKTDDQGKPGTDDQGKPGTDDQGKPGPDDQDNEFLYETGVILVRDAYLDQVREILLDPDRNRDRDVHDGFIDGVTVLSLGSAKESFRDVLAAVAEIDRRLGEGVATPNHIFSVTPVLRCPATEPEEVPAGTLPDPGICDGGGEGTLIYVSDTGLVAGASAHQWLAGVTGAVDPLTFSAAGAPTIPGYSGHGTFIAGVVRCMAPVSAVHVARDFDASGALSETEIVKRLREALRLGADIISLSAGGYTRRHNPPLSFEGFWNRYRHYKGTVLVAAAGNSSRRRPFWPAAFPQVVGVGALAANWRARAYFSDFGPWVDVYAPGEALVNAYATGTYLCREPPNAGQVRDFHGMARWSGTSFSTPMVAGLIAARMSRTGENGRQAADALLARARAQALPGVGPVLYPCDRGEDCHCRAEERREHRHHCGCCD